MALRDFLTVFRCAKKARISLGSLNAKRALQ